MSAELYVVAAGGTAGWNVSGQELAAALERCGVSAALVPVAPVAQVRTLVATDFVQARAARRAAASVAAGVPLVYCSVTAALLWPRPGAIWLDTPAAANRPGRHGLWQRPVERRRLVTAPLVMAMSPGVLPDAVVVPVPVAASGPPGQVRDVAAITYVGDPAKKRTSVVLDAWQRARREDETLLVAGGSGPDEPGIRWVGRLARDEYRGLVRRARAFLAAPRFEDYGTAQLEALADGCQLVSTPGGGPYPALRLARQLDARLVGEDLAGAIRVALDDPLPGYAQRAAELLAPFSPAAVDQVLCEQVLPVLLG